MVRACICAVLRGKWACKQQNVRRTADRSLQYCIIRLVHTYVHQAQCKHCLDFLFLDSLIRRDRSFNSLQQTSFPLILIPTYKYCKKTFPRNCSVVIPTSTSSLLDSLRYFCFIHTNMRTRVYSFHNAASLCP